MSKLILSIETSTNICSVGLFRDYELIILKENSKKQHSSLLACYVDNIFKESKFNKNNIDAISISIGPGSYTGLRIGLSFAKGMAFCLKKPIIPINTIESLNKNIKEDNYIIAIHAYGNNYFAQKFEKKMPIEKIKFCTIDDLKNDYKIYGYNQNHIKGLKSLKPSASKIAYEAIKNYDNYLIKDIKLIKPNYINPINFKDN